MTDGEADKRPPWYGRHLGVAGDRLSIASRTCQDDTTEILEPPHRERVSSLRLVQFNKCCIEPTNEAKQKGSKAEDERIIRVQRNGAVKVCFGFPVPAHVHEGKTTGEMPIGLLGIKLQRRIRHPEDGIP